MKSKFMLLDQRKKRFVLATRNRDKITEIREILKNQGFEILDLLDFPEIPEVLEDGETFRDNAIKKARYIYQVTGVSSVADDSGLEVDYLEGAPGVRSSRFAGENATYAENNAKLLQLLANVPRDQRTARFRCVIAFTNSTRTATVEGVCEGIILESLRGSQGFGYDPLFHVPKYGKTFAEMNPSLKNQISHRAIALKKIKTLLMKELS